MQNPERYLAKIVDDKFIQQTTNLPEIAMMSIRWDESEKDKGDAISINTPAVLAQKNSWEDLSKIIQEKIDTGKIKTGEKIMVVKQKLMPGLDCHKCKNCDTQCEEWEKLPSINSLQFFQI